MLVTFPEAAQTGLRARLAELLGAGLSEVIDDIEPNPEVGWFRSRYAPFWHRNRGNVVVAVGGGSVIDTAKLLQVGTGGDDFDAYFSALHDGQAAASHGSDAADRRADHGGHRQRGDALGDALGPQFRDAEEVFAARRRNLA